MKTATTLLCVTALAASAFTFIVSSDWKVKEDSYTIKFTTDGVEGTISGLKGTIEMDQKNLEKSTIDVTVDVNTLNTGNAVKNSHATAADFLDAEKYSTIAFKSTKIENGKQSRVYLAKGKLTIKGVTRDVAIPFAFDEQGAEATMKSQFEVKRTDYNLQRKGVGEVLQIELNLPLKK